MGKNDFLTPKAVAILIFMIGNRIKAKGLQKLRWYCQMCQKQCRDENGFKCHLTSDSHRRQMELFGQNPHRIVEGYSEEFHSSFMEHMRRAHPHVRIEAHKVYNEYIQHKQHIHMNSTKWLTLTEYVKYLGREGFCKVEDTPKGWFISVIHRDVEQEKLDAERSKRKLADLTEALRQQREIDAQIERARALGQDPAAQQSTEHDTQHKSRLELDKRAQEGEVLKLSFGKPGEDRKEDTKGAHDAARTEGVRAGVFGGLNLARPSGSDAAKDRNGDGAAEQQQQQKRPGVFPAGPDKKKSKVEQLVDDVKQKKLREAAQQAAADYVGTDTAWVCKGIIVKVMAEQLRDYYREKGEVINVVDEYVAEVEMLNSGDILRIDQAQLETVIPTPGGLVKVVLGKHVGEVAEVLEIHTSDFQVEIEIRSTGERVFKEYEHVCKI